MGPLSPSIEGAVKRALASAVFATAVLAPQVRHCQKAD